MNNFRHKMILTYCKYTQFTSVPDTAMTGDIIDKDDLSSHFRHEVVYIAQMALNQVKCLQE